MYDPAKYGLSLEDIPLWMRPSYRGADWSLLAVLALCIVIVFPLASRTRIPPSPQAEAEMYRIAQMAESLEAGQIYPRWAPAFNYGYGSPIFNHVAPLSHYAGGIYVALIREEPHVALKALLIGGIIALGLSTFAFLRRSSGELAGVWGTAVLLMSPYVLLTTPYLNTDVGLIWAMAGFMMLLWGLDRALLLGRGRDMLLVGLATTLLLLSHTTMSPIFYGIALLWMLLSIVGERRGNWRPAIIAIALGTCIPAFYWLPALAELEHYRWETVTAYPDAYDTTTLLEPVPQLDRNAFNIRPDLYLGIATWIWAITGAVTAGILTLSKYTGMTWQRGITTAVFIPISIGATMMVYGQSTTPENFLTPSPHEWMAVVVIACTILATQPGTLLEIRIKNPWRQRTALGILLTILCVSSATSVYTPEFVAVQRPVTVGQHFADELRGNMLGTMRDGYFLPVDVTDLPPPPTSALFNATQNTSPSTRISERNPFYTIYEIESTGGQPFTASTFDYPGWEVSINNNPAEPLGVDRLGQLSEYGLISAELQQGVNTVEIQFQNTPIRNIAWITSLVALILLIVTATLNEPRRSGKLPEIMMPDEWQEKRRHQRTAWIIAIVLAALIIIGRTQPALITRNTAQNAIPSDVVVMDLLVSGILQNGVSLLGYSIDETEIEAGENTLLTLYWRSNGTRIDPYQIKLSLFRDGEIVQESSFRHIAAWPARHWTSDRYMTGTFAIQPPETVGTYRIVLEIGTGNCEEEQLAPCPTMTPREVIDLRGFPQGQQILLPASIIVYN